jgi:hypothetical protein
VFVMILLLLYWLFMCAGSCGGGTGTYVGGTYGGGTGTYVG